MRHHNVELFKLLEGDLNSKVLDELNVRFEKMKSIDIVRTLYTISKNTKRTQYRNYILNNNWLNRWFQFSSKLIKTFNPRTLSSSIYALSVLSLTPEPEWLSEWFLTSSDIMANFTPLDLGNVLRSLNMLNIIPDKIWLDKWFYYTQINMNLFTIDDLTSSIYSLGKMRIKPDSEWLEEWVSRSKPILSSFNTQHFYFSIYAFAILKIEPDSEWLEKWFYYTEKIMKLCRDKTLINYMYSLSLLKIKPNSIWLNKWYLCSQDLLKNLDVDSISKVKYAFSIFKISPDRNWSIGLCFDNLEDLNTQELTESIQLYSIDENLSDSNWLTKWFTVTQTKMNQFKSVELVSCFVSLSSLEINPSKEWLNQWQLSSQKQMEYLTPQDLYNCIRSFSQLKTHPNSEWLQEWLLYSKKNLDFFNLSQISSSLSSLANLGIHPDIDWLTQWFTRVFQDYKNFKFIELSNCLHAFTMLNIPLPKDFIDLISDSFEHFEINGKILRQIYTYNMVMKIYGFPQSVIHTVKIDFDSIKEATDNKISLLESDVKKYLDLFCYNENGKWIPEIINYVDFYLPCRKLIIQVDGPCHFYQNGEYTVSTKTQSLLIKSAGYRLFRLDYSIWQSFSEKEKHEYISNIICI